MKIYDEVINSAFKLLTPYETRKLTPHKQWEDAGEYNLILKSEMAFELGGCTKPAISGLFFSSNFFNNKEDEVLLYGPDLNEINEDTSFARLTFIEVSGNGFDISREEKSSEAYKIMKDVEYTRYHLHPKGYMMRVSTVSGREPVRVSKEAIAENLSFGEIGTMFIEAYKRHPEVLAVKVVFITLTDFPYDKLASLTGKAETITESLNNIFNNLEMDCGSCGFKPVCDEVEGMRELHMKVNGDVL